MEPPAALVRAGWSVQGCRIILPLNDLRCFTSLLSAVMGPDFSGSKSLPSWPRQLEDAQECDIRRRSPGPAILPTALSTAALNTATLVELTCEGSGYVGWRLRSCGLGLPTKAS